MAVDLSTYGGDLQPVGYAGAIPDIANTTIVSRINESATPIDFGVAVARGAADDTCKPIGADADKILGISVRIATKVSANGTVNYERYDAVPVLRHGHIRAIAYENVVRGDAVISVTAQAGKLSGTTAGAAGAGRVAVAGATWDTTTAAGQIGLIRIAS